VAQDFECRRDRCRRLLHIDAQLVLNNFTAAYYETGVRATAVGTEIDVSGLLEQHAV
jgi:hypothetical protein